MNEQARKQIEELLAIIDDGGGRGVRLLDDAQRLWQRVCHFLKLGLIRPEADVEALELGCYALQLPYRSGRAMPVGRFGQVSLRDRAEQAAELLISLLGSFIDESLLDRTTRLLHELPQKSPVLDESKLLADAVNLDDFGLVGFIRQAMQLANQGLGVTQVAEGWEKRQQYGYWDARLKDGFHFEPVRQIARRRLANLASAAQMLLDELREEK